MNRHRQSATWLGAVLGTVCALLILALGAHASDHRGALTEEFHQTYALTADGRIELDNINGDVHISSWDQNQVKVDAVKYADTKERLDEAKIEIDSRNDSLSIRTKYPDHNQSWNWGSHNNPASVEYTLTVPRTARLDEIKLINGALDINGVSGEVNASCINGHLEAHNLAGRARLSTINGRLDARFDQLAGNSVELSSVNGSVESDDSFGLEGGTRGQHGFWRNQQRFRAAREPSPVRGPRSARRAGQRRARGSRLENVNGRIEIRHAQDGRALSPVKDLSHRDKDEDDNTI